MNGASIVIGRSRVTRVLSPADAGYVRQIQSQVREITANLNKVIQGIERATVPGMRYATKPIFDISQQLVPVLTGDLKRSGFHEVRRTRRGVRVNIGYGRRGFPFYAPIVHERTDLNHKAPTQAKYLQAAVQRGIPMILPRYADYIQRSTGLRK